jgi:hypothetical protein
MVRGTMSTKQIWVLLGVTGVAVALYGQVSSRHSYQELEEENEELHSQLAEIHSEADDAQSEVATLKSDQYCPGDDCGSPPNALGGKGLDVIVVFFDLKPDRSKRAA